MQNMAVLRSEPRHAHTIEMSVEEWIAIPDNPRQRDTEKRLAKATHLREWKPPHSRVSLAICHKTGERWKLDGHTRALAWSRNMVEHPDFLIVSQFAVADRAEAETLYALFDAQEAVETGADKMAGAYRSVEFVPQSRLLRRGTITSALKLAQGLSEGFRYPSKANVYVLVSDWLHELQRFDDLNPNKARFTGPLIAAALLSFRKYTKGNDSVMTTDFWTKYNTDSGEKLENYMDAVEALSRFMMQARGDKQKHAASAPIDVVGKGLAALELHRGSKTVRNLAAIDPLRFMSLR